MQVATVSTCCSATPAVANRSVSGRIRLPARARRLASHCRLTAAVSPLVIDGAMPGLPLAVVPGIGPLALRLLAQPISASTPAIQPDPSIQLRPPKPPTRTAVLSKVCLKSRPTWPPAQRPLLGHANEVSQSFEAKRPPTFTPR